MRGAVLVGIVAGLAGLIANLPLAWVAGAAVPKGMADTAMFSGTIWDGGVSGLEGVPPIRLKTEPLALLSGKKPVTFSARQPGLQIDGRAGVSGAFDVNVQTHLGTLSGVEPRLAGMAGDVTLVMNNVKVAEGCTSGSGTVSTDILVRNRSRWQWVGPVLSGPLTCEEGAFIVALKGTENAQTAEADLNIAPAGPFTSTLFIESRDPNLQTFLPLLGFERKSGGWQLREAGRWR